jgi:uncharacterized protein YbaP (TraB family)
MKPSSYFSKLIFVLFISFSFYQPLKAQNSLLFEVQHPKQRHSSFIFGTIHVTNEDVFGFNDRVYWAIDKCENALFELDMGETEFSREMLMGKLQNNFLNDEDLKNRIMTYLTEEMLPQIMNTYTSEELSNQVFSKLTALVKSISELMGGEGRQDFLDAHLQNYAKSKHKNVVGLETVTEQIEALFGHIDLNDFSQVGKRIIDYINLPDDEFLEMFAQNANLIEYYTQLKLDEVCDFVSSLVENSTGATKSFYDRLFNIRNDVHFQRALPHFKEKATFMAVGSGHLCGENGLLNQFKKAGYRIRPVDISSDFKLSTEMIPMQVKFNVDTTKSVHFKIPTNAKLINDVENNDDENEFFNIDVAYEIVHPLGKATFTIIQPTEDEEMEVEEDALYEFDTPITPPSDYSLNESRETIKSDEETAEIHEFVEVEIEKEEEYFEIDLDSRMPPKKEEKMKLLPEQKEYLGKVGKQLQLKMMANPELLSSLNLGQMGKNQESEVRKLVHKNGSTIDVELIRRGGVCTLERMAETVNGYILLDLTGDCSLITSGELDVLFTEFDD